MKVINLSIKNFRGLKDIELDIQSHNLLISGPNGSGKSGVIDAIEFLLTGKISRLQGDGTAGITLKKHGPHVDSKKLEESMVTAKLAIPGIKQLVTISRCVKTPELITVVEGNANQVESYFAKIAGREFSLSRRELVKFITAAPRARLEQIQALLNLSNIDNTRLTIKKLENSSKADYTSKKNATLSKRNEIALQLGVGKYSGTDVLDAINKLRATFGGEVLSNLSKADTKQGLNFKPDEASVEINWLQVKVDIDTLRGFANSNAHENRRRNLLQAALILDRLEDRAKAVSISSKQSMIDLALPMLDSDSDCVLCDKAWETGELAEYLQKKRIFLESESRIAQEFRNHVDQLKLSLNEVIVVVSRLQTVLANLKNPVSSSLFASWLKSVDSLAREMDRMKSSLEIPEHVSSEFSELCMPNGALPVLKDLESIIPKERSEKTKLSEKWDVLTRTDLLIEQLIACRVNEVAAKLVEANTVLLYNSFIKARDQVLQSLYDSIKDRFRELYRFINNSDEASFEAILEPTEAGLNLTVDFFGRGQHPPHALHSEGHQDGMGLCLFLALTERLNKDVLRIIVLDDVVMSVDAAHRRRVAELLKMEFGDFQFVITTHERVWSEQLCKFGLVKKANQWRFSGWTVSDGPRMEQQAGYFDEAQKLISSNLISEAASLLRHNIELEFESLCDGLSALVPYSSSHQWTLGPLKDAAITKFKKALEKAKVAANSWTNTEAASNVSARISAFDLAMAETNKEHWILNPAVHYNEWATFDESELSRLCEAYRSFMDCFRCPSCNSLMFIVTDGPTETNLTCSCSRSNFGLIKKSA